MILLVTTGFVGILLFEDMTNDSSVQAATTRYVGGTGLGNWTKIQDAIDNASVGDTIRVYAGLYNGSITIGIPLSLIGNGSGNTTINGTGFGDVVYVSANWFNITGFNISGAGNSGSDSGVELDSVDNCKIENNSFNFNAKNDLYLTSSTFNSIINNTFNSSGSYGLYMDSSSNSNSIINNSYSNPQTAIRIWGSSNNVISHNNLTNIQTDGIALNNAPNNNITNNSMLSCGIYLYGNLIEHWNTQTIENNTVNGKPIYYWKNATNGVVPAGAGEVIFANCTDVILENQNLSNGSVGVQLGFSNNNTIANNTINGSMGNGMYIYSSLNNTIENNTCYMNIENGIYLTKYSNNNTIINNTLIDNFRDGICIKFDSSYNTIYNNTCYSNAMKGIYIYSNSNNNSLENNNCSENSNDGIYIESSSGNTLMNNTCNSNNYEGIYLDSSDGNTLVNNTCNSNSDHGIQLQYSSSNTLVNNTCNSNNNQGINLGYSSDNTLVNNTCNGNGQNGIYLYSSSGTTLVNNTFNGNGQHGIYLEYSSSYMLVNNTMLDDGICIAGNSLEHWNTHTINTSNKVNGKPVYYWKNATGGKVPAGAGQVILANCVNVTIENQNVSNGSVGISLGFSNFNNITNNTCNSNIKDGIYLIYSSNNAIENNTIESNIQNGITFGGSNNTLLNNTCSNNYWSINFGGSYNKLINNTCSNNQWGIWFSGSNHILMNNNCSNNYEGIRVSGSSSSSNIFKNNNCSSNNTFGIKVLSSNNEFMNNTCSNNSKTGITVYSDENIIINNTCNSNDLWGIHLRNGATKNLVLNNTCSENQIGILLEWLSNNTIDNNTCNLNGNGIQMYDACNHTIANNNCSNNNNYGITLSFSSNNNTIKNNTIASNTIDGINITSSNNNTIYHNNFINNTNHAYDDGTNYWNISYPTGGNYFDNWTIPDSNSDGFVDDPYNISGGSNKDHWPFTISDGWEYSVVNLDQKTRYKLIQNAIDNASVGDTIWVGPGTYYENVLVNKTINLTGADKENVVIDGGGFGDVVYITADWVNISGFNITGSGSVANNDAGIELYYVENCRIQNTTLTINYYGIYLEHSSSNTIANNTCSNNEEHGIYLAYSSSNMLTHNTCNSNDYAGIYLRWYSNSNTFENNICDSNYNIAIYLSSSSNSNTIANNSFNSSDYGIYMNSCDGNTLTNNIYNSNFLYGIYLFGSSKSNTIANNTCNSNSRHGIFLKDSSNGNTIENNTISNNGEDGINITSSSYNTVNHNTIFSQSECGISFYSSSYNLINNNSISNTIYGLFFELSSNNNTITNCSISSSSLYDIFLDRDSKDNTIINTTFANTSVNSGSTLTIQWYLQVKALDHLAAPIENAIVNVTDAQSNVIINTTTDATGYAKWIACTAYTENSSSKDYSSNDHNITVSYGSWQGYRELNMTSSKTEIFILNSTPVWTNIPDVNISEDTDRDNWINLSHYVNDSDTPKNELIFSIINQTNASMINITIDENDYVDISTPVENFTGSNTVTVRVSDGVFYADEDFTVFIDPVNDEPRIITQDVQTINEDEYYEVVYIATEIDLGDTLIWTFGSDAKWLNWSTINHTLYGIPRNEDVGEYWVRINISDGNGGFDEHNFTITVMNTNDAPMMQTQTLPVATEDEPYEVVVNATDVDVGDPLIWTFDSNAPWLQWSTENHTLYGTPGNDNVGSYWVSFKVSDENGSFDLENFTLIVINVNDAPTISGAPAELKINALEDTVLDLANNISDIDNESSELKLLVQSEYASVDGFVITFNYPNSVTTENVTITVSDGIDNSMPHYILITVLPKDVTSPIIKDRSPTGSDVSIDTNITITFSEPMNHSSVEDAFKLSPQVTGEFRWDDNTVTFVPHENLSINTSYTVRLLTTAVDLAGNPLDGLNNWSFTTEQYAGPGHVIDPNDIDDDGFTNIVETIFGLDPDDPKRYPGSIDGETFEQTESNDVEVMILVTTPGNITIKPITKSSDLDISESFGKSFDIYFEITSDEKISEIKFALFLGPIGGDIIPEGTDPLSIKLFYFDDEKSEWVEIEDSAYDPDTGILTARTDHLTVFAPMSKGSSADKKGDDEAGTSLGIITMVGVILIVVIVIFSILGIILKKRKEKSVEEEEEEDQDKVPGGEPQVMQVPELGTETSVPGAEQQVMQVPGLETQLPGGEPQVMQVTSLETPMPGGEPQVMQVPEPGIQTSVPGGEPQLMDLHEQEVTVPAEEPLDLNIEELDLGSPEPEPIEEPSPGGEPQVMDLPEQEVTIPAEESESLDLDIEDIDLGLEEPKTIEEPSPGGEPQVMQTDELKLKPEPEPEPQIPQGEQPAEEPQKVEKEPKKTVEDL